MTSGSTLIPLSINLVRSEGGVVVFTVVEDIESESFPEEGDLDRLRGRLDIVPCM